MSLSGVLWSAAAYAQQYIIMALTGLFMFFYPSDDTLLLGVVSVVCGVVFLALVCVWFWFCYYICMNKQHHRNAIKVGGRWTGLYQCLHGLSSLYSTVCV